MVWKKWFGRTEPQTDKPFADLDPARVPRHVAIIMDGNGRWAQKRGLPRTFGHRAGAEALRAIVRTTAELGIAVLTTYAFSTENWKRPAEEVDLLMNLFSDYLDNEINELNDNGIRVLFCGQIEALAPGLREKIAQAEKTTAANTGLVLNIAVNYGGRAEIARAVRLIAADLRAGTLSPDDIDEETIGSRLYTA
ncbi:MAG TPA: polyprenyl diphosphate synthase, partial [Negativicutes bacterium]|nr:polyprenyl diphosphate synthase [Negativicutes bacterium]